MGVPGENQFASAEVFQCRLNRALGQASRVGEVAQAGRHRLPARSFRARGEKKVDDESRRLLVMPHEIPEQDVEPIGPNADGQPRKEHVRFFTIPIKGRSFLRFSGGAA